jgi:predicted nucleic acid-binding protein
MALDTDVLVAAFRSERGASRALLLAALEARYTLLVSTALWLEYEAVLTRTEQLAAMRLTADEVRNALAALAVVAEPVLILFYGVRYSLTRTMNMCWIWP